MLLGFQELGQIANTHRMQAMLGSAN